MKIRSYYLFISMLCLSLPVTAAAQDRRPIVMTFNLYPHLTEVSQDTDLTINTVIPLPARFSYFSFINFGGLLHSGSMDFLLTEQNLRWQITDGSPLDLVVQDTIRNGHDNDTIHVGLRWRVNNTGFFRAFFNALHLSYSVHLFPKRFDQRDVGGWQISHAYSMTFPEISDRLYLSGFLDHNINEASRTGGKRDNIVSENQFGVRLFSKVYAVAEFRFNEYRRGREENIALGLELKTAW